MMKELLYVILGLTAGTLSGIFGIGGGVIIIPALVFLAGMTQHQAQGTTLALMLPPIGLLAVMRYYRNGHVNFYVAAFICVGFLVGGLLGANIAEAFSSIAMRKAFGIFLMIVSTYIIFSK